MRMTWTTLGLTAGLLLTAACTGKPSLTYTALSDRQLNLETFFARPLVAHGQFQDVFGTVRRQFVVQMVGKWDGTHLTLTEDFTYEDGAAERRVWTLTKTGPDTWTGTAPGVIGTARGVEKGDRFNWQYEIDLPIPSQGGPTKTMRVTFDDWMWLLAGDRVLNRAYVKRLGVDIGDVTIFFEPR